MNLSLLCSLPCRTEGYRKVPYHYYEAGSRDECAEYVLHESAPYGGHRFITEKSVFAKWAKPHAIKFFNPPWQLSWPWPNQQGGTTSSSSASSSETNWSSTPTESKFPKVHRYQIQHLVRSTSLSKPLVQGRPVHGAASWTRPLVCLTDLRSDWEIISSASWTFSPFLLQLRAGGGGGLWLIDPLAALWVQHRTAPRLTQTKKKENQHEEETTILQLPVSSAAQMSAGAEHRKGHIYIFSLKDASGRGSESRGRSVSSVDGLLSSACN